MTGADFRATRERYGLGQNEAAAFLDVADRTVRRWETEEQDVPRSVALLFALMDRFGLTPDEV